MLYWGLLEDKSVESLHLSDFNFIMTNLERIWIIHALGLFLGKKKKKNQVSREVLQLRCIFHIRLRWRQTVNKRDSIRSMEDCFQSTAGKEIVSQIKSQGLEIINIGFMNLHISSIFHQSLQPQYYHFFFNKCDNCPYNTPLPQQTLFWTQEEKTKIVVILCYSYMCFVRTAERTQDCLYTAKDMAG